ncbi:MAG: carbohydrate porin [Cetobacterium sp.]
MNKKLLILLGSILVVTSVSAAQQNQQKLNSEFEQRLKKLEQNSFEEDQKLDEKIQNLKEFRMENLPEFHGYFRTGSDGNFKDSYKKVYDRNKNLIGRYGNEYDSYTNFVFSKKYNLEDGIWSKITLEFDNWNNSYEMSSDINLAGAKIELGGIFGKSEAFKDVVLIAGKQGWNNRMTDMIDYFYQDIDGVGVGVEKIKFGPGELGIAYLTADFQDQTDSYYTPSLDKVEDENVETSDSARAIKLTYGKGSLVGEFMYAKAPDHGDYTISKNGEDMHSRITSDDGIYTGLYYNPQNYYGLNGWGQHYAQYGTGMLGGAGLGRLGTYDNMIAHKDSQGFQIGTGGGKNITDKLSFQTAARFIKVDKVDSREYKINDVGSTYEKSDKTDSQQEMGFSVRPIYNINKNLDFWVEGGIAKVERELYNGTEEEKLIWKVSAGPQIKAWLGTAEVAIRAYVTYYDEHMDKKENNLKTKEKASDFIAGFQMSTWW